MQELVAHMSQGFDDGTVNLLMAHTHLDGAVVGKSERRLHVGDDWAAIRRCCRRGRTTSRSATSIATSA